MPALWYLVAAHARNNHTCRRCSLLRNRLASGGESQVCEDVQMPIRLALIGCGRISRRHVLAMKDLQERGRGEFVVSAVCDANEQAASERADMLEELLGERPAVYGTHQDLLAEARVEAVDLCLPHGLHHGIAVDCMEAGLHVLCEKPLGITVKACRLMIETAERTGKVLSTAAPHRRQPGQRTAKWVLDESGLIGAPLSFFHQYRSSAVLPGSPGQTPNQPNPSQLWGQQPGGSNEELPDHKRWRRDKLMSGGGPVLDSGFHYCDSLRYFFGEVEKVYAVLQSVKTGTAQPFGEAPEDTVFVTFSFKNGVAGSWSWSLAAPGEEAYDVTFYGSQWFAARYDRRPLFDFPSVSADTRKKGNGPPENVSMGQ